MIRVSTLLFIGCLSSAAAQDQTTQPNLATSGTGISGGVARFAFAHQLYRFGLANKDALTLLNAARLAASVSLTDTPRMPEGTEKQAVTSSLQVPLPNQMFDDAASLSAQDEGLLDIIDASRREVKFLPTVAVISTKSTLAANQSEIWRQTFFGISLAEIAIITSPANSVEMRVTDIAGNPVCLGAGVGAVRYCSFFPAENATFMISVANLGDAAIPYMLLTN